MNTFATVATFVLLFMCVTAEQATNTDSEPKTKVTDLGDEEDVDFLDSDGKILSRTILLKKKTYTIDKPENGDKCILSNKVETPEELKQQEQKCYREEQVNPAILDASIAKVCGSKVYTYKEIDCNQNRVRRGCAYQTRYVSRELVFRYCSFSIFGVCVNSKYWIVKKYRITKTYRVLSC